MNKKNQTRVLKDPDKLNTHALAIKARSSLSSLLGISEEFALSGQGFFPSTVMIL